jgi:hypothetical protein
MVVYANSLLAVLCSRRAHRGKGYDDEGGSLPLTPVTRTGLSSVTVAPSTERYSRMEKDMRVMKTVEEETEVTSPGSATVRQAFSALMTHLLTVAQAFSFLDIKEQDKWETEMAFADVGHAVGMVPPRSPRGPRSPRSPLSSA